MSTCAVAVALGYRSNVLLAAKYLYVIVSKGTSQYHFQSASRRKNILNHADTYPIMATPSPMLRQEVINMYKGAGQPNPSQAFIQIEQPLIAVPNGRTLASRTFLSIGLHVFPHPLA